MTTQISLRSWLLIAPLLGLAATGCGDKDDDEAGEDTSIELDDGGDGSDGGDDDDDTLPSDLDNDGWGDEIDCDDNNPDINPGADELCNEVDDDCDGDIDEEAVDGIPLYGDADGDGYGDEDYATVGCEAEEGKATEAGDCDETDPTINPGADEACNEIDDDCDGDIDEDVEEGSTWYADSDGDTFGDPDNTMDGCSPGDGWVSNDEDCDDSSAAVSPIAVEVCNEIDDDCDGNTDDSSALDADTWYEDGDEDGYGDPDSTVQACEQPTDYVDNSDDCDDANDENNPDAAEECGDVEDNDCDGDIDEACYETYEGYEAFTYSHSSLGDCFFVWWSTGERATSRCPECDWAFDVEMELDDSYTDNEDGLCSSSLEDDFSYTYHYSSDYAGYGPYLLLEYYGSYYPWTPYATWTDTTSTYGTFEYYYGYEEQVLSNGAEVTNLWYGEAILYY